LRVFQKKSNTYSILQKNKITTNASACSKLISRGIRGILNVKYDVLFIFYLTLLLLWESFVGVANGIILIFKQKRQINWTQKSYKEW
jgi:hypothetical protein